MATNETVTATERVISNKQIGKSWAQETYENENTKWIKPMIASNVISLGQTNGRKETWKFPDGTVVTMEVPENEPPITVKHAVYCFSELLHRTHQAMK